MSGQPTEFDLQDRPPAEPGPEPRAAEIPEPPVTGDPRLDDAIRRVAAAVAQPLEAQVEAFEVAHRALQDRLADVEG
jgi:hypothetical protein